MIYDPDYKTNQKKDRQRFLTPKDDESLKAKWGFEDSRCNHGLEFTRRHIVFLLASPQIWDKFTVPQANHFLDMLQFEADTKRGFIRNWYNFFYTSEEMVEQFNRMSREDINEYHEKTKSKKRAEGQGYYDKAKPLLDAIFS